MGAEEFREELRGVGVVGLIHIEVRAHLEELAELLVVDVEEEVDHGACRRESP